MSLETVDGSFTPSIKSLDIKNVGGTAVFTKYSGVWDKERYLYPLDKVRLRLRVTACGRRSKQLSHLAQNANASLRRRCDDAARKCQRGSNHQSGSKITGFTGADKKKIPSAGELASHHVWGSIEMKQVATLKCFGSPGCALINWIVFEREWQAWKWHSFFPYFSQVSETQYVVSFQ